MPIITVRYGKKCPACGEFVRLGDPGYWEPHSGNIWHPSCADQGGAIPKRIALLTPGGTAVELHFEFDPVVIHAVRQVPGAKWNADAKIWHAPVNIATAETLARLLNELQFQYAPDLDAKIAGLMTVAETNTQLSRATKEAIKIKGLGGQLRPFQNAGVAGAVKNKRTIIADPPGMGKTPQGLGWIHVVQKFPVVVVAPERAKEVWRRHILGHKEVRQQAWLPYIAPDEVMVLSGRTPEVLPKDKAIYILNWDILPAWEAALRATGFRMAIFDEIHKAKNGKSQRGKAAYALAHDIEYILGLSGTPFLNRPEEIWQPLRIVQRDKEFGDWFQFVHRYCLHEEAPILMSDFSEKAIRDICPGDKVIGWQRSGTGNRRLVEAQVEALLCKEAPLQKITFEDGAVAVATPDHFWLNGVAKGRMKGREYIHLVERAGGQHKGTGTRAAFIFRRPEPLFDEGEDYKLGYIAGLFRGDGWCVRHRSLLDKPFQGIIGRQGGVMNHGVGVATKDSEPIDRVNTYLISCGLTPTRSTRSDGLHQISIGNKAGYDFISADPLDTDAWWAGFLGGIYDAEGSGMVISQDVGINDPTRTLIEHALLRFRFSFATTADGFRLRGGRRELFRLWSIANPCLQRKLKHHILNAGGRFVTARPKVVSIENLPGVHNVYTLTTTTGNYVAYGLGSKNCAAHKGYFGLDTSGHSNTDELNAKLRSTGTYIRRRREDVYDELPPKERTSVPIRLSNWTEYKRAEADLAKWLGEQAAEDKEFLKTIAHLSRDDQFQRKIARARSVEAQKRRTEKLQRFWVLKKLAAKGKMDETVKLITDLNEMGEKVVIFAWHVDIQHEIYERLPRAVHIFSSDTPKVGATQAAIDGYMNNPDIMNVVCCFGANEAITLNKGTNVVFLEFAWGPGTQEQAEDRVYRMLPDGRMNKATCHYTAGLDTIDEEIIAIIDGKAEVVYSAADGGNIDEETGTVNHLVGKLLSKYKDSLKLSI